MTNDLPDLIRYVGVAVALLGSWVAAPAAIWELVRGVRSGWRSHSARFSGGPDAALSSGFRPLALKFLVATPAAL